ncbi:hypothetical protein PVAP13_4KG179466 [Panicum virgatum]|uniref:Sulfotransferase n=1 Tax=Panicum virgatum TaxID=38727 RepID=A0A8T0TNC0_PANVG|nr:hypothetical protein PVAP13_4KG179466 [Panicum virgatum]
MAAPADTGAAAAAASTLVPHQLATPHGDLAEILPSLPLETRCLPPFHLRRYKGFSLTEKALTGYFPAIHAHFEPRPDDIFLVSFPKSGTTWLKPQGPRLRDVEPGRAPAIRRRPPAPPAQPPRLREVPRGEWCRRDGR